MTAKRQPNEKDYITNKVLTVFSVCLVGVLGLMMLYRVLNIGSTWGVGMMLTKVMLGIGVVGVLCGVVKILSERKKGEDVRYHLLRGLNITIVFAALVVIMFIIMQFGYQSVKLFYVLLPALAVYYLIFHSYPREFFIVSVDCGVAAALLWLARIALASSNYGVIAWAAAGAALALACVQIALVLRVKKIGVTGLVDGKRVQLFASAHAYLMMHATAIVMAIFVVLGAVLGAQMAYYLIFAAFAYLFVAAVYYTVKML